jgi:hypothetical protein
MASELSTGLHPAAAGHGALLPNGSPLWHVVTAT